MTQPQNGGVAASDVQNGTAGTDGQPQDGGNDIEKQLEEMKVQVETLKKERAGQDRKIAEYLKEKEKLTLSSKTAEEQLEYYKNQAATFERKETFRQAFKEIGLNPDEFIEIVDEQDVKIQAEKFANLLKSRTNESVQAALESFKTEELKKKGAVPQPTETVQQKNAGANNAIRAALGR
jgi:hypothetical protein|nr:MAG TPA: protein of unknown function (DUF4355) [Caudoviricetes sp.]